MFIRNDPHNNIGTLEFDLKKTDEVILYIEILEAIKDNSESQRIKAVVQGAIDEVAHPPSVN